ncbi:MAG: hypothetical protein H0T73_09790 [Ardenticatenales bacterium]|nr:hypothetical protein [Ardenticatenales bacterium]
MTQPDAATDPTLRAALHFFDEAVLLTRYHRTGGTTSYPVAPQEVAATLGAQPLSTGLLPRHTLFWRREQGGECLGLYVPRRRWAVRTTEHTYQIPLPPLLLVGWHTRLYAYALKRVPRGPEERLFHFPGSNLYADGTVCMGDTPLPACSSATIYTLRDLFLTGSAFNDHGIRARCRSYPEDVRALWAALAEKTRFPLGELLPTAYTLGDWSEGRLRPA